MLGRTAFRTDDVEGIADAEIEDRRIDLAPGFPADRRQHERGHRLHPGLAADNPTDQRNTEISNQEFFEREQESHRRPSLARGTSTAEGQFETIRLLSPPPKGQDS